jgi:NADPH-dependent glutamate synthase beta subunit-like oxidoreductase
MTHQAKPALNWPEKILTNCLGEEPPPCQAACPLDIRVREKIRLMQEGKLAEALAVVLERCPFPGILGRICTHPCEPACTRNTLDQPIAIRVLKRHLADLDPGAALRVSPGPERPQRVAVVGGGPAGLMAAYELRRLGYPVTLFEAEPFLGGALRLYIPPYRLPREVLDRELGLITHLGVEVRLRTRLGRDVQLEELRREFAAIFLAVGCHKSLLLEAAGETLSGVWYGLDFLRAANSGAPPKVGARVAVIGGGNTAVDAARTARRLGADRVTLIYRKSREEMPALPEEIAAAEREGIQLVHRLEVKRILGREGLVAGLQLKEVAQVFDEAGRFAPVYFEDRLSELEADTAILAVGQTADFRFFGPGLGFDTSSKARLDADPVSLATRIPGVFAGGDLVTGPGTAVAAFAAGRRAALGLHAYLQQEPLLAALPPLGSRPTNLRMDTTGVTPAPRTGVDLLPLEASLAQPAGEVDLGFSDRAARAEAARCLLCTCSQCVKNCTFLQHYVQGFPATAKGIVRLLAERGETEPLIPYSCHYCGLCQAVCPQDLHPGQVCLEYRERLVAQGAGPLPPHKGVQNYVNWGTSPTFTLSRPDPATGRAARVFFPGCALPAHSPHLVRAAYAYLRAKLPDTGLLLNCCGAPSQLLGEQDAFSRVLANVAREMAQLGATELIAACTHCLQTIGEHLPEIKTRSIYEVLLEMGLPEGSAGGATGVFNIHDACGARQRPEIHEAVRRLVAGAGHRFEEMEHSRERSLCCGSGGMAPAVNPTLARKMTEFRLSEANRDLVTYCAACRARLAGAGRPTVHLLELLFNPGGWQATKAAPPAGSLKRWWRRWRLKRHFQGL